MSEGVKRKRASHGPGTPSKKVAFETTQPVKVTFRDSGLAPVLVASPGLARPSVPFDVFSRAHTAEHNDAAPRPVTHDILLHSSKHPVLDYTAAASSSNADLAHYIAVFQPSKKEVKIVPAFHVSLKRTLRAEDDEVREAAEQQTITQQRQQLASEFGTKKAKKMMKSRTVNAIVGGNSTSKDADLQSAVLEGIATSVGATRVESTLEEQLAAKPIPKPNLGAEAVDAVYTIDILIPPSDMRSIPHLDWQDTVRKEEELRFHHRFPAFRAAVIGKSDDVIKLKALRYLSLLLDFNGALGGGVKFAKKVPKKEVLSKRLSTYPDALVDSVRRRFSEDNELDKFHLHNLYTHMAALSLYIDGWTTDISNLRDDLGLDNKKMTMYFRELGCRVAPPSEKEREQRRLTKAAVAVTRIAKLKLPLEFPRPRVGRRR